MKANPEHLNPTLVNEQVSRLELPEWKVRVYGNVDSKVTGLKAAARQKVYFNAKNL